MAALIVVLSHLRAMAFPPYAELGKSGIFWKAFYFLTSLGHEAVIVFFVLSGYLVGGEVLKNAADGTFSWKRYLAKRVVRLYLVLVPALLLTSALDHLGYAFFNGSGMYDRYWSEGKEGVSAFFVNLFMLQLSHGPLFGTNDPLWSLANEFWYYLMFPLLLQALFSKVLRVRLVSLAIFGAIVWLVNTNITLYFLIWLLGAAIRFVPSEATRKIPAAGAVLAALFAAAVVYSRYKAGFWGDLLAALLFSALVVHLSGKKRAESLWERALGWRHHRTLADFSYSLYLLHFPMMMLLSGFVYDGIRRFDKEVSGENFLFFLTLLLLLYLYAYLVYLVTERHTRKVTARVYDLLNGR